MKHIAYDNWYFDDLPGLDSLSVHVQSFPDPIAEDPMKNAPHHVTIRCYGECWTTFFSSPCGTPAKWLRSLDTCYIVDRLYNPRHKTKSSEKIEKAYLTKIWEAIKSKLLTGDEYHQQQLAAMLLRPGVQGVDYTNHADAPRFDTTVVVQYLGNDQLYGPATAAEFDWRIAEGKANIDKFWMVPDAEEN